MVATTTLTSGGSVSDLIWDLQCLLLRLAGCSAALRMDGVTGCVAPPQRQYSRTDNSSSYDLPSHDTGVTRAARPKS